MTLDSPLSLLFVLGLATVGLLAWSPRAKTKAFCLLAVGVWLLGIVAANSAFQARGTIWLREPMRRFTYDLKGVRGNSLGKHHVLLAPAQVQRLPALFDGQTSAVALAVDFDLQPEGRVSAARVSNSSGNAILDSATLDSVRAWQFGPLPPTYSPQRAEKVRVIIENRYEFLRQSRALLGLLGVYAALWVGTVVLLPRRVTDDEVAEGVVRRALSVAGFLAGLGWIMVWRLAPDLNRFDLPSKQLGMMVVSLVLVWGTSWLVALPAFTASLVKHSAKCVGVGVLLLMWTRFFGTDLNTGQRLWLSTPIGPFQTVELVKLLLLCFVAGTAYAATHAAPTTSRGVPQSRLRPWRERYRGLMGGSALVFGALVLMSDFGPLLLLALLLLALLWAQGYPRHAAGGFIGLLLLLTLAFASGYPARWHDRITMWRAPWVSLKSDSAQLAQGRENTARVLWSVSSGGLTGQGLGQGYPDDIGAVESDFIFAAISEELGWLGGAAVISLLLVLALTGFQLAQMRDDALAKILACGLGAVMAIQTALTIGGNLALWPLTGITLPFLSYGRSSLLISFVALGLMVGLAPVKRRSWDERPFPHDERVNLALMRLSLAACAVFALLVAQAARLQFPALRNAIMTHSHAQNDAGTTLVTNPRLDGHNRLISTHVVRGSVLDRNGTVLVETTPRGRLSHDPALYAPLVGMQEDGQTVGLERSLQEALLGQWDAADGNFRWPRLGGERRGFDVRLTLDDRLQKKAYNLLRAHHYRGCLVGVEPATGHIPFAVSNPSPTGIAEWIAAYNSRFDRASQLASAKPSPSIYRTWYQPGSTFKTLTAAAALECGAARPNQHYRCKDGYFPPGGGEINDHNHLSHGDISLSRAMAVSCNQTFAQVGADVGWQRFWDYSTAAGLSTEWSLLPSAWRPAKARFWPETVAGQLTAHNLNPNERSPDAGLARSAIGQQDVRATPLYLATWAGAIANGGTLMPPSLVTKVTDQWGRTVASAPLAEGVRVMRRSTARELTAMMERVVTDAQGTGKAARVEGIRVAAKTGTPQLGVRGAGGGNNALLIAFAPVEKPRIAIAVVVEGLPDGGPTCGPLAAEMMRAVCQ